MPDDFDEIERRFGKAPAAPVADDFDAIEARFATDTAPVSKPADGGLDLGPNRDFDIPLRPMTASGVAPVGTVGPFPGKAPDDPIWNVAAVGAQKTVRNAADAIGRYGGGLVDLANEGMKSVFGVKFDTGEQSRTPVTDLADAVRANLGMKGTNAGTENTLRANGYGGVLDVAGKIGDVTGETLSMMGGGGVVGKGLAKVGVTGPMNTVLSFAGGNIPNDPRHPKTAALNGALAGIGSEFGKALFRPVVSALLDKIGPRAAYIGEGLGAGTGMVAAPSVDDQGAIHNMLAEGDLVGAATLLLTNAIPHAVASPATIRAAADSLRADAAKVAADPVRDEPLDITIWRGRMREAEAEGARLREQAKADAAREAATAPDATPTPGEPIEVTIARGQNRLSAQAAPEAPAAPLEEVIQPKAEEPAPKVETPEDVARELDKPTNAPKRKVGISAEAGFADPSMLTDPLKAAGAAASRGLDWTRGTMAPRIQEMAPTAREEIGNLVSRNSGASTDALGVLIKKGVEKYGIDPARMGAAINEGQLRGVREKFKSQQAEATATIERVRSEIEDARKNLADEASAYAEARVKRADDAARHDQFRAEYVAVKTAERAKDSIGASAKERDAALADAREKYADAVASTKADLPRDAEPGERAAVDDSLKTLRAEYDAVVKEIRQTHETVVREALADVRRAKADAARVDDSALSRVEKEKIRADYEADRIRREGMKKRPMRELYSELAKADTAHWNAMLAESRVQSKIGEGKPFATEAEYDAFLKDPKNKGFIDDVVRYVRKVHERDYRDQQTYASAEDAPIRDTRLGIHSNLIPAGPHGFERYGGEAPAEGVEIPRHSAAGRPSALRVRKSPFAREAMGSGTYSDNIVDILMRPLSAQGANAAKHRLARALVADGVAVAIRPGRGEVAPKEIAGFPAKEVPEFEVAALGGRENRRLYVAEPIYQDIRNITKADATLQSPAVMKAINAISVISTVSDSVAMIGNSTFGLVGKMGTSGKPLDVEIFRKATGLRNLKDVFANLGKRVGRITTLDDAKALFEVAEIGGSRDFSRHRIDDGSINPFAWIGHFSSKLNASARVIMSEAYDRMYPEGNPHRSNAAKAEFINRAMGQYQTPGMDRLTRTLRQWGFSPFVSAGKATASRGLDVVSGNPGVWYRDAGVKMKSAAVANTLATLAGVAGASALGTYLATGSFDKPKGVGHLDVWTGEYDKATGRPLVIPLGRYMAVTTGAQMLGVDALVDNLRQGKTLEVAIDAAAKQAVGRIARLMAGPVPNAAAVVMFGHGATSDMPLAEPAFSGNESQMARNVGAAVDSFAPTWRLLWGMAGGVNKAVGGTDFAPDVSVTKEALKQLSYLANITRPSDSEIESANDRIDWYRGSEAVGYVKRKLSTMDPEDRAAYVESVLPRFSDEFRPTAAKALRGSLAKLRARQVASGGK